MEPTPAADPSPIPSHLVAAILATAFCCLPLGVVAIVFAAQVKVRQEAGDLYGARRASDQAGKFTKIAFGIGLVIKIVLIAAVIVSVILALNAPEGNPFGLVAPGLVLTAIAWPEAFGRLAARPWGRAAVVAIAVAGELYAWLVP